jgi:hypothetical protein
LSRKRKAKQRLEQSRKKALLKTELRLAKTEATLLKRERAIAAQQYEDAMIAMYRDSNMIQRIALEAEYQKVAGSSLKRAREARIIAALQSQPCGGCD